MKYLKPIFFLFSLLVFCNTYGQDSSTIPGDIIIRLENGVDADFFIREMAEDTSDKYELKVVRQLSKSLNIWLLHSDSQPINDQETLFVVRQQKEVMNAQFNHIISLRSNVPDDPEFDQQWSLLNDGSIGLENADLDVELAWDITTGGLSPQNDSIVVCIIDDGIDLFHEDLTDNLWRNHTEIPNNNIDDDNNGFVDDYWGWNSYSQDDNIGSSAWHGTPIAGIIGAKGNNNTGVSGINWGVKMMIVKGGGNEADAIAAYDYPLEMRKLYNSSNGTQGAFVVATNTSWGVNGLQEDEAPLWCAMYDSLGTHGVLNCGATANNEIDVDTYGDMPTSCTSDYLITVTNINRFDEKVIDAAYGAESIDLGAYGELSYTTAYDNAYNTFGGTSAAAPHVAGSIALLYAAPCLSFAELSKEDPAEAALLMKDYLLQGSIPNESLEGISLSGGRLNTHNSLQLLLQDCLDDSCFPPYGLVVDSLAEDSVKIVWNTLEADSFLLSFRAQGELSWNTFPSDSTYYHMKSLESCTYYDYRVQAYCADELSNFSSIKSFKTLGCCDSPKQLTVYNTTEESIAISWNTVAAAENYLVRIKSEESDWLESELFPENTFEFFNLDACTEYTIEVESICNDDMEAYISTTQAYTKDCGSCRDTEYCLGALPDDLSFDWLSRVKLNDAEYETLSNAYSLTSDTNLTLNINAGYDLTLESAMEQSNFFLKSYGAWIDYNQDGVFDAEEKILHTVSNQLEVNQHFLVPENALIGTTRMRVVLNNYESSSPCSNLPFGEIEDYCVNISDDTTVDEYLPENSSILIFPNPTSDKFTIRIPEKWLLQEHISIRIYNSFGQLISSHENKNEIQLSSHNLAKGVYTVLVENENNLIDLSKLIIF